MIYSDKSIDDLKWWWDEPDPRKAAIGCAVAIKLLKPDVSDGELTMELLEEFPELGEADVKAAVAKARSLDRFFRMRKPADA